MILYGSMALGIILVLLGKLNKVFGKEDFSWGVFIKTNLISILMNLVAGIVLVINQAEMITIITKIIPNSPFVAGGIFSFVCGVSGLVLVQFLVDLGNPGKKTAVGVNK